MLSYNDAMAEIMWHLVLDESHGYSQPHRAGDGTIETFRLSDETLVSIHGGDYDCSEAVRSCVAAVGLIAWDYNESYMWTGNEIELLTEAGFVQIDPSNAVVGDILWTTGHTELVVGGYDGILYQAGFRISETGDIDGRQGDQNGRESTYSSYKPDEWDVALRYAGPSRQELDIEEDESMVFVYRPEGDSNRPLKYYDGVKIHVLEAPKHLNAVMDAYRNCHGGRDIPMFDFYGSDAFEEVIGAGEMRGFIHINAEPNTPLVYYDGVNLHPLSCPDEQEAINKVARRFTGTDLPCFGLGTKEAPWGTRFMDAVKRI